MDTKSKKVDEENLTDLDYEENADTVEKNSYPYSEWMLSELKSEYLMENERENKIASKASAFISLIIAIFALYIPQVPFENIKKFFANNNTSDIEKTIAIFMLIVFGTGLVFFIISFIEFIKAYRVRDYNRVAVDKLLEIAKNNGSNTYEKSEIAEDMARHYHTILRGTLDEEGNMQINTNNASLVRIGIILTVVGFLIISVATVALRIVIVVD